MANDITNYWDFLISAVYTSGFIVMALKFKKPISLFLEKNKVDISLPGLGNVSISPVSAGVKISTIMNEFKERRDDLLKDDQKKMYDRLCSEEDPIHVTELIPGFNKDIDKHIGALRALRGLGLIVPDKGREWSENSCVVLTKFGRVLNENNFMKK